MLKNMGCCGEREKLEEGRPEQKWSYIALSDFKSTSCVAPLSYGVLYISLLISVAVYVIDIFTAVNLLFSNRWAGQVQPVIPFKYTKWIFAGCIILSLVLLVYRWVRAIRVIRRGVVAASYLDPLAVRVQSVRMGEHGRGWRRFLLFTALTKGRKGAEYVALFTYFSFEAWLRIVLAEGPRQIINAITLYTVMQANLEPVGQHAPTGSHSAIGQFFVNVRFLAASNREQATILFGMLFTLIIWLFSALSLILAVLFYVLFLWHHIPSSDGTLARYCRRKVDKRLAQIVGVKITKAIERENKQRMKEEAKSVGKTLRHQPTVPDIDDDKLGLSRHTSEASFRTESQFADEDMRRPSPLPGFNRPMQPTRAASQTSAHSGDSYLSDAPLLVSASKMGYDGSGRPYPRATSSADSFQRDYPPHRPTLSQSQRQSSQQSHTSYKNSWSGPKPVSPTRVVRSAFSTVTPEVSASSARLAPLSSNTTTPAPLQPQTFGRKPMPRSVPERDGYEMQPAAIRSGSSSVTSAGYTAYNPTWHTRQNPHNEFYAPRSTTAPPQQHSNSYARPMAGTNLGLETLPPLRVGTAPIETRKASTSAAWAARMGVMDGY